MKTQPYRHQQECLDLSFDLPAFAILLEQGLGKTKVALDTAERLFKAKKIEALIIIAPNGVHTNWARQEIPKHLDCLTHIIEWHSGRDKSKKFQQAKFELFAPTFDRRKLRTLILNVEAFSTPGPAVDLTTRLVQKFSTLVVLDESTRIKTPSAARTKRILSLGRSAKFRRILTGTPVTQSPFDLYAQFLFLDQHILGFHSFYAFKHEYGRWQKKLTRQQGRQWEYENLIEYRNLDQLKRLIAPYSYRRTKRECLDLPEKIYQTIYYDLTPEQRRLYDQVLAEGVLTFEKFEELVPLQITRLLRCQQIVGGFVPIEVVERLPDNPKLNLLLELIEDYPGKIVIWARFRAELTQLVEALSERYDPRSIAQLHGGVPKSLRLEYLKKFQEGDARFLIGQQQSGIGIDLFAAETVFYYSNTYSYEQRYQTEDRCHRIGLKHPVLYIDLVARDTIDEKITDVLAKATRTAYDLIDVSRV